MDWILGFFTGGGTIWAKVAAILGVVLLLGGAVGYVYYLRSSLTIAEQKIGIVQGALDAEKAKSTLLLNDVHVIQNLQKGIELQWKGLDIGQVKFTVLVKTKVDTAVADLKTSPESEEKRLKVETTINTLSHSSTRCSEITIAGATPEDKANLDLKDVCPELLK